MSTSEKHDRQVLFIHQGKGQRDRYVPIGMRATLWIARYVKQAREQYQVDVSVQRSDWVHR